MARSREIRYDDPASWPPLGALRSDDGGWKPATTDGLGVRRVAVRFSGGFAVRFTFPTATTLEWEATAGGWEARTRGGESLSGGADVEVFQLAPELYVSHFRPVADDRLAGALVLDLADGSALAVLLRLQTPVTSTPAVSWRVSEGTIDDAAPQGGPPSSRPPPSSGPPMPTDELVGKRVIYDYGDGNVYEHVYLTPSLFTWLCLRGPEEGLADTESCAAYKVRDGTYLFTWREKVVPCGAAVVIDLEGSQTCGAFLGRDGDSGDLLHFTWGAHIVSVESTKYPPGIRPPRLAAR